MFVIGITGNIGTGKTTVASLFGEKPGVRVISADRCAHACVRRGSATAKKILIRFGTGVLTAGRIDRAKLAAIVFADRAALAALEAIIHPVVIADMKAAVARYRQGGRTRAVVLDVPLLFEAGVDSLADVTVVVAATYAQQMSRVTKRSSLSKAALLRRMKAQMPLREKIARADFVIDNSRTVAQTKKQVNNIWYAVSEKKK